MAIAREQALGLAGAMSSVLAASPELTDPLLVQVATRLTASRAPDSSDPDEWSEVHASPDERSPILFLRWGVRAESVEGTADISLQEWLGQPLLAVHRDPGWNPPLVRSIARSHDLEPGLLFAYNRRDVALVCAKGSREIYLDVIRTAKERKLYPINQADVWQWSLSASRQEHNRAVLRELLAEFALASGYVARTLLCDSSSPPDPCVRKVKQKWPGWCVPAALAAVLHFHADKQTIKKAIPQGELADELKLKKSDSGLPKSEFSNIPAAVRKLTLKKLNATVEPSSTWDLSQAQGEIDDDCPFAAVSGNHARAGGGYGEYQTKKGKKIEGITCMDPWGGWTCWESVDANEFAVTVG